MSLHPCFLGLTPQVICLSPLRGSHRTIKERGASRGFLADQLERRRRDRFMAGQSTAVPATESSREAATDSLPTRARRYPPWNRAAKRRQIHSLGREPQEPRAPLPPALKGRQTFFLQQLAESRVSRPADRHLGAVFEDRDAAVLGIELYAAQAVDVEDERAVNPDETLLIEPLLKHR